jgi:hypothetical protein
MTRPPISKFWLRPWPWDSKNMDKKNLRILESHLNRLGFYKILTHIHTESKKHEKLFLSRIQILESPSKQDLRLIRNRKHHVRSMYRASGLAYCRVGCVTWASLPPFMAWCVFYLFLQIQRIHTTTYTSCRRSRRVCRCIPGVPVAPPLQLACVASPSIPYTHTYTLCSPSTSTHPIIGRYGDTARPLWRTE